MQNIAAKIGFSETAFIKKVAANVCNIRFLHLKQKYLYADMRRWLVQK